MPAIPPVCDYEGSDYRTRFWEGKGRSYEDRAERIALRRLMPPIGAILLDVGAGFGRLANEYDGYEYVVLFDYSRSLLREAQARLRDDPRILFVAGNWYEMPFVDNLISTLVQVRTLHHAADVPRLLRELARISRPHASYVLEYANKRNAKAILRYLLRRQSWSPFTLPPVEFTELNYDFHPAWIRQQLAAADFTATRQLAVSFFRLTLLKSAVPTSWLVELDRRLQSSGRYQTLTPSLFVLSHQQKRGTIAPRGSFFACPRCKTPLAPSGPAELRCPTCRIGWAIQDGLYDFKEPL